jgi:uncharacterized delta-60 repeat protein
MKKQLLFLLFIVSSTLAHSQAGGLDLSFNPDDIGHSFGFGAYPSVRATAEFPDGRIIIAGEITAYNATPANNILMILPDGTVDPTFDPGSGPDGIILAVALQSDGKIIIGGEFNSYDGTTRHRVARLNSDGSLDPTFQMIGTGIGGIGYTVVNAVCVQSDGRIIAGGQFNSYNNGVVYGLIRFNSNGTRDMGFNNGQGSSGPIHTITVLSDDRVLITGIFNSYNGITRHTIARLASDGTLDESFDAGMPNDHILTTTVAPDGKVIIGGRFTSISGVARGRVARLHANGDLDGGFTTGTGAAGTVLASARLGTGRIVIGGQFTQVNGQTANRIAVLEANGMPSGTFTAGTGMGAWVYSLKVLADGKILAGNAGTAYKKTGPRGLVKINTNGAWDDTFNGGSAANWTVLAMVEQPDGKILIGGRFTTYNGHPAPHIARLWPDGTRDTSFQPDGGPDGPVHALAVLPDGKILIGGTFGIVSSVGFARMARLFPDGSLDNTFNPGNSAAGSMPMPVVHSITPLPDSKILIGGHFDLYDGTPRNSLAVLNANGTLDMDFIHDIGNIQEVHVTRLDNAGNIIVGGLLGAAMSNVVRLDANGNIDATFNPSGTGANGRVTDLAMRPDGGMIIAGDLSEYNGISRAGVAGLNADGTLDMNFVPPSMDFMDVRSSVAVQADGKVLVGGVDLQRLELDGTVDGTFGTGAGMENPIEDQGDQDIRHIRVIHVLATGAIMIAGDFTSYDEAGRNRIARLHGDDITTAVSATDLPGIFRLLPNPTMDALHIVLENELLQHPMEFTIYSMEGRLIHRQLSDGHSTWMDVSNLKPGAYVLQLQGRNGVHARERFLKL